MIYSGPLVSVIIPTAGVRSDLLLRAVNTALAGFHPNEIEVLVIPNGPACQWQDSIATISTLTGIKVLPIEMANVCAARNHGLIHATGQLIRFLDDDDFLIPETAVRQCLDLLNIDADISSYSVRIEDQNGICHKVLEQPEDNDFIAAILSPQRLQIPLAHVYRTSFVKSFRWNEAYNVSEDIVWLLDICSQANPKWLKGKDVVGVWFQHSGPRLSYAHAAHKPNYITALSILNTIEILRNNGRMNEGRLSASAAGLWLCIHRGFIFRPFTWHFFSKYILNIAPDSHPQTHLFSLPFVSKINPLWVEWLLFPLRSLIYILRWIFVKVYGQSYIRRL